MYIHVHTLNRNNHKPYLVVGVQTYILDQYVLYEGSNMYKIRSCTFDVQATTMIYNSPRANLVVCVHT